MSIPLLRVEKLRKWFRLSSGLFSERRYVKAVDNVSFELYEGETLGIVGESGCGKSTLGRAVLRLIEPTDGKIVFENREVTHLPHKQWQEMRKYMQMIFQDSHASLNARMRVGKIIEEPLKIYKIGSAKERKQRVLDLLKTVGLPDDAIYKYPHEFSGGQRQRIDIARALVLNPRIIVCDEAVSALDVSIQSQVLNLMRKLQKQFNLAYLFISHDMSVIRHISDRVVVMYLGRIVEVAEKNRFFANPKHPYSRALLSAIPVPDPKIKSQRIILEGDVPSPVNPPSGCHFRTRCPVARTECSSDEPELRVIEPGHSVACPWV